MGKADLRARGRSSRKATGAGLGRVYGPIRSHWTSLSERECLRSDALNRRLRHKVLTVGRDFNKFPVPSLTAVATEAGVDPQSTVYMSRRLTNLTICPAGVVEKGLCAEQEPIAVLPYDCPMELFGQRIWESLLAFRRTPNVDLRSRKRTDWPAYRASGAKSVRAFENEYVRITVGAFPCVLRVEAAVPADDAQGLFVGRFITNACEFEALGELLHLVFRCSVRLAEQEFA